jgi:hypothetical protein
MTEEETRVRLRHCLERCTGLGYLECLDRAETSGFAKAPWSDFLCDLIDFIYELTLKASYEKAYAQIVSPLEWNRYRSLMALEHAHRHGETLAFRPPLPKHIYFHEFVSDGAADFLVSDLIRGMRYCSRKQVSRRDLDTLYVGAGLPLIRLLESRDNYCFRPMQCDHIHAALLSGNAELLSYVLDMGIDPYPKKSIQWMKVDHGLARQARRGRLDSDVDNKQNIWDVLRERDILDAATLSDATCYATGEKDFLVLTQFLYVRGALKKSVLGDALFRKYFSVLTYLSDVDRGWTMGEFAALVLKEPEPRSLIWFLDRFDPTSSEFRAEVRKLPRRRYTWEMIEILLRRHGIVPLRIADPYDLKHVIASEFWRPHPPLTTSDVLWENFEAESLVYPRQSDLLLFIQKELDNIKRS